MRLKNLELNGFKSFAKKSSLEFTHPIVAIVGPNGSGKSNIVEAFRFVLGEQSIKSMRGKSGSDLIFSGSKNLPKGSRASVSIFFNNEDKVFRFLNNEGENINLNYENISIGREVYVDGLNKYSLNNTDVRLKDIHSLLSSVNIGTSSHHIISQGEADRVLNASPRDRKEMIEDALGLKVYQYKIKESEKKLEKANFNIKEVGLLRRENAPHLNFLKKQIEKFEKAKEMKSELLNLYFEYLKKEDFYLKTQKSLLDNDKNKIDTELGLIREKIKNVEEIGFVKNQGFEDLKEVENKINELRRLKNELERKLGRLEGIIESLKIRQEFVPEKHYASYEEFKKVFKDLGDFVNDALSKDDFGEVKNILLKIKELLFSLDQKKEEEKTEEDNNSKISEFQNNQKDILSQISLIDEEEKILNEKAKKIREEINEEIQKQREEERERFSLRVKEQELSSALNLVLVKEDNLNRLFEAFNVELNEAKVLVGHIVLNYVDFVFNQEERIERFEQEELKRKIERIKIKLEDSGLINEFDVLKEYKEAQERDEFLAKEIEDLSSSIQSLNVLIEDLKKKIEEDFRLGIAKINEEFKRFFGILFGGGDAKLTIIVENRKKRGEDEEGDEIIFEQGVDISVSLPTKKVKELNALSGGERSLTSIALLFAVSQVNPPPFLVLDETDAALDEANSRKYGDMLERLSEKSQLVVVTHNRETMSRAGVLYGVTIGIDGASKLLSVKFEEAQAIAK